MFSGTSQRPVRLLSIIPALALLVSFSPTASAKTPGKTYCFNGICHRTNTLQETAALVGKNVSFKTSYYDDCKRDRFNPCGLTASGEEFRPNDADNAASPIYPEGTVLLVRNPLNGLSAVLRVNNAGPYWGNRKLDVSRGAAEKLGFKKRGVAKLDVRVIKAPTPTEARYKKNRRYDAVPGPIGQFASLDAAADSATRIAMGLLPAPNSLTTNTRVAPAEAANSEALQVDTNSPAEALKAEARRVYGVTKSGRRFAPASITAQIAPIHRSRQQYTIE